jgi:hypothetical protein
MCLNVPSPFPPWSPKCSWESLQHVSAFPLDNARAFQAVCVYCLCCCGCSCRGVVFGCSHTASLGSFALTHCWLLALTAHAKLLSQLVFGAASGPDRVGRTGTDRD